MVCRLLDIHCWHKLVKLLLFFKSPWELLTSCTDSPDSMTLALEKMDDGNHKWLWKSQMVDRNGDGWGGKGLVQCSLGVEGLCRTQQT